MPLDSTRTVEARGSHGQAVISSPVSTARSKVYCYNVLPLSCHGLLGAFSVLFDMEVGCTLSERCLLRCGSSPHWDPRCGETYIHDPAGELQGILQGLYGMFL